MAASTQDSSARLVHSHFPNSRNKIRTRFLFCRRCSIFPGGRRRVCHYPGGRCPALRTLFSRIARLSAPGNTCENKEKKNRRRKNNTKDRRNAQARLLRYERQTSLHVVEYYLYMLISPFFSTCFRLSSCMHPILLLIIVPFFQVYVIGLVCSA